MAWEVVRWVLENGKAAGNSPADQAVALVRAEHAKPDGTGSCPSIKTVAKEACMSERLAQIKTRVLEARGIIKEERSEGRYRARTYRFPGFMNSRVNPSAPMGPPMGADSDAMGAENDAMGAENGASWVNPSAPDPLVANSEPKVEPTRARARDKASQTIRTEDADRESRNGAEPDAGAAPGWKRLESFDEGAWAEKARRARL